MKNTYIVVIVLVLLVGAALVFGVGKKAEAPVIDGNQVGVDGTGTYVGDTPGTTTITTTTTTTAPAVKEFTISGNNFSFTPSTITVNKGDRVKITFENSAGFHDFVIDAYGVATKQTNAPTTEVIEFTADKAGSFEYYCSVGTHREMGMKGTLIVN